MQCINMRPFLSISHFSTCCRCQLGISIHIPPEAGNSPSALLSYCLDLRTTYTSHGHGVGPITWGLSSYMSILTVRKRRARHVDRLHWPCDFPFMLSGLEAISADYIITADISAMLTYPGRVFVTGARLQGGSHFSSPCFVIWTSNSLAPTSPRGPRQYLSTQRT